jgi:hypothetical protein
MTKSTLNADQMNGSRIDDSASRHCCLYLQGLDWDRFCLPQPRRGIAFTDQSNADAMRAS